jgi:hypothetical protein
MSKRVTILTLSLALAACGPTGGGSGGSGGATGGSGGATGGSGGATGGSGGGTGGSGGGGVCGGVDQMNPGCATGAQYIYAVDENNHFFRYNPALPAGQRYMDLGALSCPSTGQCPNGAGGMSPATPFSMGVDRNAIAWVLYCDGSLFKVDINNNIACTATSFTKNQNGFEVFGMGFSANAPMSMSETLFIGGGAYANIDMGSAQFGSIAFPSMGTPGSVTHIGSVGSGWPELAGTGDAQLWGFFPSDTGTPRVAQLNKTNGADATPVYMLNQISGMPAAWAFGFFCDSFYIFLMRATDIPMQTTVYKVDRMTGAFSTFDTSGPHTIVGAGVSTCAPIVGVHYDKDGNVWYDEDYRP